MQAPHYPQAIDAHPIRVQLFQLEFINPWLYQLYRLLVGIAYVSGTEAEAPMCLYRN